MTENCNTQPISIAELFGEDYEPKAADVEQAKRRLPDAATVRAVVVAVVVFVGAVLGRRLDQGWVDPFISAYVVTAPLVLGWWVRKHAKAIATFAPVSEDDGGKHRKKET